jgi:hypothetical protein
LRKAAQFLRAEDGDGISHVAIVRRRRPRPARAV